MGYFKQMASDFLDDPSMEHNRSEWENARRNSTGSGEGLRPRGVVMVGLSKARTRNAIGFRLQNWA